MCGTSLKAIGLVPMFFLCIWGNTYAQDSQAYKKNTAYVSFGTIIFSQQLSISYERLIVEHRKMKTCVKLNHGYYLGNHADFETNAQVNEKYLSVSGVQLLGPLELNGGIAYVQHTLAEGFDPDPAIDYGERRQKFDVYGSIGLRFTKDAFLIRVGIGNYELIYLGIGFHF